jgi:cytoskeletal protein CcmA (bactofilin family)
VGIVTSLGITLTVFALAGTWLSLGIHQHESSAFERSREQAVHAAEAGINDAISRLAADIQYTGSSTVQTLRDETGEYEVSVSAVDPSDPYDTDRFISATGYAPSKTANQRAVRKVEQQVVLEPSDGFQYALFASPGGIAAGNNAQVRGDIYSAADVTFGNSALVYGDVVSRGTVTTANFSTIAGTIHAKVDVNVGSSNTTVQGNVFAGGNVTVNGRVMGDVQAGGTITVGTSGFIGGRRVANSTPPDPPLLGQPTFTWNATDYTLAYSWTSGSTFMSHWSANVNSFRYAHRSLGGDDNSNKITLDQRWNASGDTTIVSNSPIGLARDITNTSGTDINAAFVTYSVRDPAISLTSQVTVRDPSLKILLFAPNGVIDFSQLKDFHGTVYAKQIRMGQNFTMSRAEFDIPGFDWDGSSATHFIVKLGTFREVPAN